MERGASGSRGPLLLLPSPVSRFTVPRHLRRCNVMQIGEEQHQCRDHDRGDDEGEYGTRCSAGARPDLRCMQNIATRANFIAERINSTGTTTGSSR